MCLISAAPTALGCCYMSPQTCRSGLTVESQEVVPIKTGAADRRSMIETTMRAMPVVVVKPRLKLGISFNRVEVSASINPFSERGLNETFGLTVGAWSVGTSEAMASFKLDNGVAKGMGTITVTIIGEQATGGNAQAGIKRNCSAKKINSSGGGEARQDLSKGDTGVVIDGDMEILPTGMVFTAATAIGTDNDVREAAQLLDIQVEKITGSGMLVANQGNRRLQMAPAIETKTAKNTAHGSAAEASDFGDGKTGQALTAKLLNALNRIKPGAARTAKWTGGTIEETIHPLVAKAADPLSHGTWGDGELGGRRVRCYPLKNNAPSQLHSTEEGKSCILMNVHSGLQS